ncbi:putative dehydrogenase [Microbacteriaceae bacterium SG_E_30_P1]|uniref:Dehydrogenase n=1 Tax=Antiquaquibacter oligotrophicus TaxID=2880260 RepID=A0ABT6KQV2_9MICO|nr:Gfo/Idh/MocA family oxidoreductase [Antiquaquibacter oligotrophicus]MDH6182224.1 putative dehydrogenase [Antiquaquibacter oligotrophicus]UDF12116.1 Gfo/Idh/MocA family oxidoreductase [Antiquaquibacter oligotrophicus]
MILPPATHTPLRGGAVQRWGILAPGGIADAWAEALHAHTDQRVVAVASRSQERAQAFADRHGIPRAFGTYEQLVADPEVDVVYIAPPHTEHLRLALLAIAAGKHVLVEKPIGISAAEARELAAAARAAGVFAMEAMWSRFLPQTTVVDALVRDGVLGDVLTVTADFGAVFDTDPNGRAYNPALGGGALLDVGVYPAWFAHFVLGAPTRVTASGSLTSTGVDAQAAVILDYNSHAQAVLTTSMLVATPLAATISGTAARVDYPHEFMGPSSFRVLVEERVVAEFADPNGFRWRDGLCYQAVAVAQHIADGLTESPLHSLDDTIAVLDVLDAARAQIG